LRALRGDLLRSSSLLLELLTNGLHLRSGGLVNNRVRAVLTEELTGVVGKNVRVSQD